MALAVGQSKKAVRTGLQMNIVFFFISLTVLIVMGILMWKDTNPEWLSYQKRFRVLERQVLEKKRALLLSEINHPNYLQDYQTAKAAYLDAKSKFDASSSTLEGTEADLEEMELRAQAGQGEEGAADDSAGQKPSGAPTTAAAKASKGELDDLDKEFGDKSAGTQTATKAPEPSGDKGAAKPVATKASDKEMADLDKEFADDGKSASKPSKPQAGDKTQKASPKGAKGSSDEMAELDKEFADGGPKKGSDGQSKAPKSTASKGANSSEMDELDKEFKDKPKGTEDAHGTTNTAAATPESTVNTFEEAAFTVDQAGAQTRLDAAQRDLLLAQRNHNKEMIGLPEDATLKRQLSDARLKEAEETEDVAQTGKSLEDAKATVKTAAQVAKWATDVATLDSLTKSGQLNAQPSDQVKLLQASKTSLDAHIEDLKRDLRLVEGRISRNKHASPVVDQNYVDRLGAIDRCTTCHMATEEAGFENAPEPFRTHSAQLLKYHGVDKFGCVSCHGGWGNALEKNEAHGGIIGKGRPLLTGVLVQSSCGKCHGETRQLAGEETYLAGAQLFKNSGCLGCHKVDLNRLGTTSGAIIEGAPQKAGPALDRVGEKLQASWLVGWLQNPQSHSLDARMPNLGLEKEQASAIATFLLTQHEGSPPADASSSLALNQTRITKGKRLFDNLGCFGCHTVLGEGRSVGPELTNIRSKVSPQWLYGWIQNPKNYFPNSRMPVLNLTTEQSEEIGDYLLSVGTGKPGPNDFAPSLTDERAKELGAKLVAERGCAGCHDIKGFDRISAPELTHVGDKSADVLEFGNVKGVSRNLYSYVLQKITDPRSFDTDKFKGKMPKFGLAKEDAKTIDIYLMSLSGQELPPEYTKDLQEQSSSLVAGRKIFEDHDCNACHRLSGEGGKVGPDLTREGEMVRPGWMFEFLKNPTRIRWWQDSRMPNYHLTDNEATTLTEYFMALANQPAPYEYTPVADKLFPLARIGAKYFEELKCQSCHPLAGKQGVAGGDTKKLGPDLGMAPTRLKKDWMFRFLKDPQGFSPGTQMPTFSKPDEQYQAIVDFLMKQKSP